MKKLLFTLGFCCSMNMLIAQEQQDTQHSFQDSHHNVIGYIRSGGSIFDNNNKFLGQFKSETGQYTVYDHNRRPVGAIVKGNEIKDADNTTVGYLKPGTDYATIVEDANHTTLGVIKRDGTVEDANHAVKGYAVKTEPMWAAAYYFFLKL